VFDSGLGGLTVLRQIRRARPDLNLLCIADQAHVPYGGRPLAEVRDFALGIARALVDAGCEAIVMACNISSATAATTASRELQPARVIGMIDAAMREVRANTGGVLYRPIGLLATAGTVASRAYDDAVRGAFAGGTVRAVACPALVPLIEDGLRDTAEIGRCAERYLEPLAAIEAEPIILGCTHYPLVIDYLQQAAHHTYGRPVAFVDPALGVVDELGAVFQPQPGVSSGSLILASTLDTGRFQEQASRWLSEPCDTAVARWEAGTLHIGNTG